MLGESQTLYWIQCEMSPGAFDIISAKLNQMKWCKKMQTKCNYSKTCERWHFYIALITIYKITNYTILGPISLTFYFCTICLTSSLPNIVSTKRLSLKFSAKITFAMTKLILLERNWLQKLIAKLCWVSSFAMDIVLVIMAKIGLIL